MRNLLYIIISLSLLISCQPSENRYENAMVSYLYDTLNIKEEKGKNQFFLILNPNNNCIGCYHKGYLKIQKIQDKKEVFLITDERVKRIIGGEESKYFITDYNQSIFNINPEQTILNKFLVIHNRKIKSDIIISSTNIDTIDTFIQ